MSEDGFLKIEKGAHGLFYVTSPYVPGLLIASPSLEEAYREVPVAIIDLYEAAKDKAE
jgi:hypothetical protein